MFILDTDTISHHQDSHPVITAKIATIAHDQLFITSVSVEEQLKGRLGFINRHRNDLRRSVAGHIHLIETVKSLSRWNMLPFDSESSSILNRLRRQHPRLGSQDLRIAAIALRHGFTVVTSNVRDFAQVPNLRIEDWTASA